MDSKARRNRRIKKSTPQADPEETEALLDLLWTANKQNSAHCCRLLDISYPTWKRWSKDPPTAWFWPHVIRLAIKHTLAQMVSQRRATTAIFRNRIRASLNAIPQSKEFELEIAEMAYDAQGAELHLRTALASGGKWWSTLQLSANNGGYSKVMLRRAAKNIGVVMKQEGYGADKDSYWRLPNEDDD